jgi:hypothetical protein
MTVPRPLLQIKPQHVFIERVLLPGCLAVKRGEDDAGDLVGGFDFDLLAATQPAMRIRRAAIGESPHVVPAEPVAKQGFRQLGRDGGRVRRKSASREHLIGGYNPHVPQAHSPFPLLPSSPSHASVTYACCSLLAAVDGRAPKGNRRVFVGMKTRKTPNRQS